ncbi:glycosyltransferase [Rhodanobacter denitrificans]|uniref:glycosyltransferase n=1 Tax=Rhodanobacter denitrificans TaxID=666685 RepID=UPI001F175FF5|nr:glycosyltransferase [Rhodanobacter denitrificans]UJM86914.1 glycosyltransferase [Rhodanobacter denitrificans]
MAIIDGLPRDWIDSLRTLDAEARRAGIPFWVAALDGPTTSGLLSGSGATLAKQWSLSKAVEEMFEALPNMGSILLVTSPVSLPEDALDRAVGWLEGDSRIATVSFLSNAAGPFSFPYRNTATGHCLPGHDENSLTKVLRRTAPDTESVPVPMPAGPAILVSRTMLASVGGFDPALDPGARESIAEMALRSAKRGFQHRLDAGTYVFAQWFSGFPAVDATEDDSCRHRLHVIDSSFPALYDYQKRVDTTPAAIAMNVARSKASGLRILIDGSCLGPMEMGTQVQTVELLRALVRRDDVRSIDVAVPNGKMPDYAADLAADMKVRLLNSESLNFDDATMVDILHRPFQPDRPIPWARWRSLAKRVVVTLQDLIAYRIGTYHPTGQDWLNYRHNIAEACAHADHVVVISEDTRQSIIEERMDISREQVTTVKNGCNHLDETADEESPLLLIEKGMIACKFILVLGATYAHKNRDLAIRVWQRLRERGHPLALVMAGANVPKGSSRAEEAVARRAGDDMLMCLPDVSSGVRTWLLRHASVVLYPTSAEGFGLIPFEAAAMGTPTAHVNFGPLRELIDDPAAPRNWVVDNLADYTEALLIDPGAARENIDRILRGGAPLTWDETASGLVDTYRRALACPPRN